MLEIKEVSFIASSDGQERKILDSVSYKFPEGSFTVITGPNGSGKSTLASIVMGLKKQTGGKVFWNGEDISDLSITDRAKRGISYSFQQPVKFKGLTAFNLLCIARGELISLEDAGEYLKKVGLEPEKYLNREINGRLSGGELKRMEIATVLAKDSDLMIFDEPEAGIDLWSFDDLVRVIRYLKKSGKILIVISHQERILKIADKILLLKDGEIKEFKEARMVLPKILGEKHGN